MNCSVKAMHLPKNADFFKADFGYALRVFHVFFLAFLAVLGLMGCLQNAQAQAVPAISSAAAAVTAPATAKPMPSLLLAEVDRGDVDVTLYLVSEKFDGVRAFWDGAQLRTRSGKLIAAPAWFIENFPTSPLDGELWMARGQFDATSAAVRRQSPDEQEWRKMRYLLFEYPEAPGNFAERVEELKALVAQAQVPWLQVIPQFRLANRQELRQKLKEIVRAGGEGLMLHRADALYISGRNEALLKVKLWHDAEALVIGHKAGKGKYTGMLGALRVRSIADVGGKGGIKGGVKGGVEFMLGSGLSDAQRAHPPAIGSLVTFRYRELTPRGVPRFASFYRMAADKN